MDQWMDVIIVGGGPAGLSAALVLGRARKKVILIDDETPRNWVTRETHGFVTRDGASPREFREAAKEQIAAYPSVHFVSDTATGITGTDGDFTVTTAQGASYRSKKILFAVGKKDLPLEINGLTDVYGKSAFVCPYCDGWELRDQPLVIIVNGDKVLHMAKVISGWSDHYTFCTNGVGCISDEEREELKLHNVEVFETPIQTIVSKEGMVEQVRLNDGTTIPCAGIFFQPRLFTGSDLPKSIGCDISDSGTVIVDEYAKTSVAGVYSAGDAASEMYQAIMAASLGGVSAVTINNELNSEKWDEQKNMK